MRGGEMKVPVFLFCGLFLSVEPLSAASTGAAFLRTDLNAESAGMGGISLSEGIFSLIGSPAGLRAEGKGALAASHAAHPMDARETWVGYAHPIGRGAWGLSVRQFSHASLEGRGEDRRFLGRFNAWDRSVGGAYAFRPYRKVSIGMALKTVESAARNFRARSWAFDGGIRFQEDSQRLAAGLEVRNAGPGTGFGQARDPLPLLAAATLGYRLPFGLEVAGEARAERGWGNSFTLGANYALREGLLVRGGYVPMANLGASKSIAMGLGLRKKNLRFDYAVKLDDVQGNRQVLSLAVSL
jgi:hypothetical protein